MTSFRQIMMMRLVDSPQKVFPFFSNGCPMRQKVYNDWKDRIKRFAFRSVWSSLFSSKHPTSLFSSTSAKFRGISNMQQIVTITLPIVDLDLHYFVTIIFFSHCNQFSVIDKGSLILSDTTLTFKNIKEWRISLWWLVCKIEELNLIINQG